jgi:hypothetical protein
MSFLLSLPEIIRILARLQTGAYVAEVKPKTIAATRLMSSI